MAKRKQEDEPQEDDFGTPEARRQSFHIVERPDPNAKTKRVRVDQGLTDWYLRRSYITQIQADALKKWQADAYLAGMLPACVGSYGQSIRGGIAEFSDLKLAAIARRTNAIAFMTAHSPYAVPMLDAITINEKPAGRWIMEHLGGAPHDALVWLHRFTDALARHYGLTR